MIRTFLVAAAAVVALPAFAHAQTYYEDPDGIVVHGHRGDSYSIVVSVAGKPPGLVREQISDAAHDACHELSRHDPLADLSSNDMNSCVDEARRDAMRQYDDFLDADWSH